MISKWNYLPLTSEQRKIEEQLVGMFPNCPSIARLLVQRGMKSEADVRAFFSPTLSQMPDPFLMKDMDKAVNRLNRALGAKEYPPATTRGMEYRCKASITPRVLE